MLKMLTLVLPVLLPSWRFFKSVEPSPRVQWSLTDKPEAWHNFRPRPASVGIAALLGRLFWNPQWNERLYVLSCAERQHLAPEAHNIAQINACVARDVMRMGGASTDAQFRFRLVFVQRLDGRMIEDVVFVSAPARLEGRKGC